MKIRIKKSVVSKVIVFDEKKILLLKRSEQYIDENSPWVWDLPGGHVNFGESPRYAAQREVKEETQLSVSSLAYNGKDTNVGKLTYFYETDDWEGSVSLSEEHSEHRWVEVKELDTFRKGLGDFYYKMILNSSLSP